MNISTWFSNFWSKCFILSVYWLNHKLNKWSNPTPSPIESQNELFYFLPQSSWARVIASRSNKCELCEMQYLLSFLKPDQQQPCIYWITWKWLWNWFLFVDCLMHFQFLLSWIASLRIKIWYYILTFAWKVHCLESLFSTIWWSI